MILRPVKILLIEPRVFCFEADALSRHEEILDLGTDLPYGEAQTYPSPVSDAGVRSSWTRRRLPLGALFLTGGRLA